jgi:hypothetical protein
VNEIALVIRDLAGRGGVGYGYRIVVEPADPVVQLQIQTEGQVNVPKSGTVTIPVNVVRQGYNGPLTLTVANPPAGLSVRSGQVADRALVGALSISAAADAAFGPVTLDIVGTGASPSGALTEHASKLIVFSQQQNQPAYAIEQKGLVVAPTPPRLLTIDSPADPIEAVHGFPATIPIKVKREAEGKGELTIPVVQPLPQGLSMGESKIGAEAAEGTVTINIDPGTSLGPVTLGFTARGKIKEKDQVFGIPAVSLNIVRPVSADPAIAKFEIKPSQTFELKGKVTRRGPFKEAITLQLNGLPEGLKAEPATVAADASEFTLKVVADEKANAAEAKAQLAIAAFKLAGKDYNTPTIPIEVKVVK